VAFRTAQRMFQRVIYSRRGYIVPRSDGRILAGSTSENAGFDKSVTESAATRLREVAFEISPSISGLPVADQWSGLRPFAADGLPVLGEIVGLEGLFIATAHYRNGILLAPLTGRIAADRLVDGTDSTYFTDFGLDRFSLRRMSTGN
ncbi:MAG TPA: FAD-dependent oxidoreductase, partial [Pyrinomonadaceae bacterium]|nr:FAD-dependent oxidoreductase [Pyrinomonadaceae bacterium]